MSSKGQQLTLSDVSNSRILRIISVLDRVVSADAEAIAIVMADRMAYGRVLNVHGGISASGVENWRAELILGMKLGDSYQDHYWSGIRATLGISGSGDPHALPNVHKVAKAMAGHNPFAAKHLASARLFVPGVINAQNADMYGVAAWSMYDLYVKRTLADTGSSILLQIRDSSQLYDARSMDGQVVIPVFDDPVAYSALRWSHTFACLPFDPTRTFASINGVMARCLTDLDKRAVTVFGSFLLQIKKVYPTMPVPLLRIRSSAMMLSFCNAASLAMGFYLQKMPTGTPQAKISRMWVSLLGNTDMTAMIYRMFQNLPIRASEAMNAGLLFKMLKHGVWLAATQVSMSGLQHMTANETWKDFDFAIDKAPTLAPNWFMKCIVVIVCKHVQHGCPIPSWGYVLALLQHVHDKHRENVFAHATGVGLWHADMAATFGYTPKMLKLTGLQAASKSARALWLSTVGSKVDQPDDVTWKRWDNDYIKALDEKFTMQMYPSAEIGQSDQFRGFRTGFLTLTNPSGMLRFLLPAVIVTGKTPLPAIKAGTFSDLEMQQAYDAADIDGAITDAEAMTDVMLLSIADDWEKRHPEVEVTSAKRKRDQQVSLWKLVVPSRRYQGKDTALAAATSKLSRLVSAWPAAEADIKQEP